MRLPTTEQTLNYNYSLWSSSRVQHENQYLVVRLSTTEQTSAVLVYGQCYKWCMETSITLSQATAYSVVKYTWMQCVAVVSRYCFQVLGFDPHCDLRNKSFMFVCLFLLSDWAQSIN